MALVCSVHFCSVGVQCMLRSVSAEYVLQLNFAVLVCNTLCSVGVQCLLFIASEQCMLLIVRGHCMLCSVSVECMFYCVSVQRTFCSVSVQWTLSSFIAQCMFCCVCVKCMLGSASVQWRLYNVSVLQRRVQWTFYNFLQCFTDDGCFTTATLEHAIHMTTSVREWMFNCVHVQCKYCTMYTDVYQSSADTFNRIREKSTFNSARRAVHVFESNGDASITWTLLLLSCFGFIVWSMKHRLVGEELFCLTWRMKNSIVKKINIMASYMIFTSQISKISTYDRAGCRVRVLWWAQDRRKPPDWTWSVSSLEL